MRRGLVATAIAAMQIVAAALAASCAGNDTPATETRDENVPDFSAPTDVAALPPAQAHISDCAALHTTAQTDTDDAVMEAVMCPGDRGEINARARLLATGSSADAAALAPKLVAHPELAALARLVGHVAEPLTAGPWRLEPASSAVVTPIDGRVLGQAQIARAMLYDPDVGVDDRTRARAYLAKVYTHAMRQLGIGPLTGRAPFARLLAGLALVHARGFCTAYWRRRVSGLSGLFAESELDIVRAALALESTPGIGDTAVATHQLDEARRYLGRTDVKRRLAARVERGGTGPVDPRRLAPGVTHLQRMLRLRFVDLATSRAVHLGSASDGPGLAALEQLVVDGLAAADGAEYSQRVARRFAAARKSNPPPREHGPGSLDAPIDPSYPGADALADRVLAELAAAHDAFSRRRATGRAVLQLRRRPDALLAVLGALHAEPAAPGAFARPVFENLAAQLDDGNLEWLRARVAADRGADSTSDAAIRREFALVARSHNAMPR